MIKHIIFDIEGVLLTSIDEPKLNPKAKEVLEELRKRGIMISFLSNITRKSRLEVFQILKSAGLSNSIDEVITAGYASLLYIKKRKRDKPLVFAITEGGIIFDALQVGVKVVSKKPVDFVIVGMKRNVTFEEINFATECVLDGAEIIGAGATNYYKGEFMGRKGIFLGDLPIVRAIETATGKRAVIMGKPFAEIFRFVVKLPLEETAIVGDKIQTDIKGGRQVGITTIYIEPIEGTSLFTSISGEKIEPHYKIKKLEEILDIVSDEGKEEKKEGVKEEGVKEAEVKEEVLQQ